MVIMWDDGFVKQSYHGEHFGIYTCIKPLHCIP